MSRLIESEELSKYLCKQYCISKTVCILHQFCIEIVHDLRKKFSSTKDMKPVQNSKSQVCHLYRYEKWSQQLEKKYCCLARNGLASLATTCQNREKVGKFFEALKKLGTRNFILGGLLSDSKLWLQLERQHHWRLQQNSIPLHFLLGIMCFFYLSANFHRLIHVA